MNKQEFIKLFKLESHIQDNEIFSIFYVQYNELSKTSISIIGNKRNLFEIMIKNPIDYNKENNEINTKGNTKENNRETNALQLVFDIKNEQIQLCNRFEPINKLFPWLDFNIDIDNSLHHLSSFIYDKLLNINFQTQIHYYKNNHKF